MKQGARQEVLILLVGVVFGVQLLSATRRSTTSCDGECINMARCSNCLTIWFACKRDKTDLCQRFKRSHFSSFFVTQKQRGNVGKNYVLFSTGLVIHVGMVHVFISLLCYL